MDKQAANGQPASPPEACIPAVDPGDYRYELPPVKIARYPLEDRDKSRLLVYREGIISDALFSELPGFLPGNTLLVRNETKVIQARMIFHRPTGARIEIFLLEPADPPDYQQVFAATGECSWKCLVGNARKWKESGIVMKLNHPDKPVVLKAEKTGTGGGEYLVRFRWDGNLSFGELIDRCGKIPIPPYLERDSEPIDRERYQTVYSRLPGSVAAPTAGLHFSSKLLEMIERKGIPTINITLHVGAGTFRPIEGNSLEKHQMHTEFFSVSREALEKLMHHTGPVIAVGTTSVRTLESLFLLGEKIAGGYKPDGRFMLGQWEAYGMKGNLSRRDALSFLAGYMESTGSVNLTGSTQIMIVPGYRFRLINGLITNFHLPKSSLVLLVAAWLGEDWRKVYAHALEKPYRFLSYGDGSLLLP